MFKISLLKFHLFIFSCLLISFTACQKTTDQVFTIPTSVQVQTVHHELIIPECEVYIKYHADRTEFPGFFNFEGFDTLFYTNDFGRGSIENIPLGTHWLMARGYDDELGDNVKGVLKVEVSFAQPAIDTILYVGEE